MLTDAAIKRIKRPPDGQTAPDKHSDALGLQLHVFANGRMSWVALTQAKRIEIHHSERGIREIWQ